MQKLIIFVFSVVLFASCSSGKRAAFKTVKFKGDFYSADSEKWGEDSFNPNLFIETDLMIPSKLKVENQELEEKELLAFSNELTPSFISDTLENNFKNPFKSIDSSAPINKENNKIKKSKKDGKWRAIFNLIGVSLLLLITGLDVLLALVSIAFDGFYGVSLLFFFSSLILTHFSIKAVKNLKEKHPKTEPKSKKNQPYKNRYKIVLQTLGLIVAATTLMAILISEIIL